jgi:hypothetical protein
MIYMKSGLLLLMAVVVMASQLEAQAGGSISSSTMGSFPGMGCEGITADQIADTTLMLGGGR